MKSEEDDREPAPHLPDVKTAEGSALPRVHCCGIQEQASPGQWVTRQRS
jgi:hypothetical protein